MEETAIAEYPYSGFPQGDNTGKHEGTGKMIAKSCFLSAIKHTAYKYICAFQASCDRRYITGQQTNAMDPICAMLQLSGQPNIPHGQRQTLLTMFNIFW